MGVSSSKTTQAASTPATGISVPTRQNKYGLMLLNEHMPSGSQEEYPIDIVAVHGFTGDAYSTWQHQNGEFWLQRFLPGEFPGARIFSFGYTAEKYSRGTGDFETFARSLLEELKGVRRQREVGTTFPKAFTLVALVMAVIEDELYGSIRAHTLAILFMATPHCGSDPAKIAATLSNIINIPLAGFTSSMRSDLMSSLKRDAPGLKKLAVDFRGQTRNIKIASFMEEKTTPPFKERIVDDQSGIMAVGGERIIPMIDTDHQTICRYPSRSNHSYKRVLNVLRDFATDATEKVTEELTAEELPCLHSLAFPEMSQRRYEADTAQNDTCIWISHHPAYLQWVKQPHGLLWVKGKPGTGKSTLMASLNRRFRTLDRLLVLDFFFHGRGTSLQKSQEGLFRTLLHQIFSQSYEARPMILKEFQAKKGFGEMGQGWTWQLKELQDLFCAVVTQVAAKRDVIMFVDALDEAGSEVAVTLVGFLHKLNDELVTRDCWAKMIISSRHYPVVALIPGLEIRVEDENAADIQLVVRHQLMTQVIPRTDDPSFDQNCKELERSIINRAAGLFQWISVVVPIVVEAINDGRPMSDIYQEIERAPAELFTLYEHILKNIIKVRNSHETFFLMQWVCFAARPLSLTELRYALALNSNVEANDQSNYDWGARLVKSDQTMQLLTNSLSGGLVEVQGKVSGRNIVQFVHQTVNDFLISGGLVSLTLSGAIRQLSPNANIIGQAHNRLSRSCIHYIRTNEPSLSQLDEYNFWSSKRKEISQQLVTKFPFLDYTVKCLFLHAEKAEAYGITQEEIVKQLRTPLRFLDTWTKIFEYIGRGEERHPESGASIFHLTAGANLISVVRLLLEEGTPINQEDDKKFQALHYSAKLGHLALTSMLLDRHADIEAKTLAGNTPLEWAASNGHWQVVRLLLQRGAGHTGNALQITAFHGNLELVRVMIENGADVRSIGSENYSGAGGGAYGTALHAAAERGNEKLMQMLLDNGADIHSKGGLYGTVLQAALSQDNPDTLKILNLLIKLGVDINQKGGMYNTAIEAAIQGGSEANRDLIVRTLIRQGADVNTCGNLFDGNPLQAAAFRTQSSCVRILLEHGAKFNAEGYGSFDIEVQEAAYQQDESLLRSRLATSKRSSHRHAIYYSTLLEVSKEFGYVAVADLILKNGGVNLERVKNHQRCKFLIDRI